MAENSNIAWCKSTFNPWIGCTKVGPGCDHCYASVSTPARTMGITWGAGQERRRTSVGNWARPNMWNAKAALTGEFWPVFCASLADVFDNEVPMEWRDDLFRLIEGTPALTWLLLTKRIGNVKGMQPYRWQGVWPVNIWLGATVVNQEEADRDIPKLLQVPAAKRFVSYEPALGPVDWTLDGLVCTPCPHCEEVIQDPETGSYDCLRCDGTGKSDDWGVDWIIVGGESNQPNSHARPFDIAWARSTVEQCKSAGVACFVKQLGSAPECDEGCGDCDPCLGGGKCCVGGVRVKMELRDRAGADTAEWPEDLRVQEFPT